MPKGNIAYAERMARLEAEGREELCMIKGITEAFTKGIVLPPYNNPLPDEKLIELFKWLRHTVEVFKSTKPKEI